MFTLPNPPGFSGFDPDGEIRFHRRHLPHWRQDGATYFITFRTADSIPSAKAHELRLLKRELDFVPDEERSRLESAWREFMKLMERYLDEGHGACPLRKPSLSAIVANAMHHFDGERYALFAFAVMPNHAHVVLRPLGENTLGEILKSWKSFSARLINKELGGEGAFWQAESYDRIVRDGEELFRIVQYVGRNGEKAGL
jgi:putative transposase